MENKFAIEEAKHLTEYDTRHEMMQSGRRMILNFVMEHGSRRALEHGSCRRACVHTPGIHRC